jgi:hypothetical protein
MFPRRWRQTFSRLDDQLTEDYRFDGGPPTPSSAETCPMPNRGDNSPADADNKITRRSCERGRRSEARNADI